MFDLFQSNDYRITFEKTNDDKVTTVSIGTFSEKDLILNLIFNAPDGVTNFFMTVASRYKTVAIS